MATTLNALVMKISMDASEVEAGSKQVRSDVSRVSNIFREMQTESDKLIAKAEALTRQFKRGKMTPEEYAKAMEYLEAKFKAVQDEADGTNESLKKQEAVVKRLLTAIETPLDRIRSDFNELNKALESGTVDAEDHAKMVEYLTQQYMDASGQSKKFADENTSDMRRVSNIISKAETETEKLNAEFNALNRLYRRGKIGADEYAQGIKNLNERHRRLHEEANQTNSVIGSFAKHIVPTVNLVDVFRLGVDAGRAALEAFASAAATVRDKMSELDPIIKQSRAMGELTSNVQTLAFALSESAGMSIEETSQSLMELQKRLGEAQLGTGEAANALKILGLNAAELSRLSPVEQFRLVAEELQKVEDATMRAYLADKLFAEQGKKLVNGLTQSNQTLAEAEQAARNFGLALSDVQASRIEAANDALGRVSAQIDGIITQFSAELAPAVQFFATELSAIIPLAGNMRLEFEMLVDTMVASTAIARNFTAGLIDGLIGVGAAGSQIGDAIATDDVATVLEKYHAMRDAAYETADAARKQREEAAAAAMAAGQTQAAYQKQVDALKDQISAAMGLDVAHQKALEARKEMTFVQNEYLTILENQLAEEKAIAKQKEQAAKAEEKRLADIEALRKRGQDMIEQGDPAKMVEKQIADLGVMLGVLGESFRSTYDREVQKIIKDAAAAKLGSADRPGLIEAGTQAAADVAMQGVFDKQEEQLRLLEEQKLMQQAQLQAQQETNRRLAGLGIVGVIR